VSGPLESIANVPVGSTATEATTFIEAEVNRWHMIVGAGGILHL
jgi:hypothetical protein